MEDEKSSSPDRDLRIREIEASIREGKLMLQVLRSLPSSENNDAFIHRFEELIHRLEQYGPSSSLTENDKISSEELREQLEALKHRQENVRALLAETAGDSKIQLAKLTDLIDESNRFEGMVSRLLDITQRAQLNEASGFLNDILTRFHDLRSSFKSLQQTYEAVTEDSQLSEDSRNYQLASFQEFLSKLNQSLDSTKECFFTIYHLVKANIEAGMTNGSLRVTEDHDNEDTEHTKSGQTVNVPTTTSSGATDASSSSLLDSRRAYLNALQDQTKVEREEIDRLIKQRDGLLQRLNVLRTTAASSINDDNDVRPLEPKLEETDAQAHVSTNSVDVKDQTSETSVLEALLFTELESKRRVLENLKSQLSMLCPVETGKRVVPKLSIPALTKECANGPNLSRTSSLQSGSEEQRNSRSTRPSPSPVFTTQTENPAVGIESSDSTMTPKLDSVTFQQPEAVCVNDNTERLYENMREARIRWEEQRERIAPARLVPGLGGASIANSQDRTTSATWGGSSPVPSSSSSSGCAANEVDVVSDANCLPETSKCEILLNSMVGQSGTSKRTSRRAQPTYNSSIKQINSLQPVDSAIVMPQLGRSPSPPRRAGATLNGPMGDADGSYLTHDAKLESDNVHRQLLHRVQMLETSVGQLYQVCRYLVIENTQLSAMLSRPSVGTHSAFLMDSTTAFPNQPTTNEAFVPSIVRLAASPPVAQSLPLSAVTQQHENLQLLQHQIAYLNAQHEFQTALRQSRFYQQQQHQQHLSLSVAPTMPLLNSMPSQLVSPISVPQSLSAYNNLCSMYSTAGSLSVAAPSTADTCRAGSSMGPSWMPHCDQTGSSSWNWSAALPPSSSSAFAYSTSMGPRPVLAPEPAFPPNVPSQTDPLIRLNSPLHPVSTNRPPGSTNSALAAAIELLNQMWIHSTPASAPQTL